MVGRDMQPAAPAARDRAATPPAMPRRCSNCRRVGAPRQPAAAGPAHRPGRDRRRRRAAGLGSHRTRAPDLRAGPRATAAASRIDGAAVELRGPADAIRRGLAFCPEERKTEGIVGDLSVRENIVLALQARRGLLPYSAAARTAAARRAAGRRNWASPRPASRRRSASSPAATSRRCCSPAGWPRSPRLLILDEPTRGIDVAAKEELIRAVATLARARHGGAVHLGRDRRSAARVRPHRRAARTRARWANCPAAATSMPSTR